MFQAAEPMPYHLRKEILQLLKKIVLDFIKLDVVRASDLFPLDVDSFQLHVPLDKIYLGINATRTLLECEDLEASMKVRKASLDFMIELVKQIRAHFNVNKPALKAFETLVPVSATKCTPSLAEAFHIKV